jgi:disulfide bond formation protein DsbB
MSLLYCLLTVSDRAQRSRPFWLLLAGSALLLLSSALYLQYVTGIAPCVLCIYQRVALCGSVLAALIALLQPRCGWLRGSALLLWSYSAWRGLQVAWLQTQLQHGGAPWLICPFKPQFPEWLPLDRWLPWLFQATGECHLTIPTLLHLSLPQWLLLIFTLYLLLGLWLITVPLGVMAIQSPK